MVMGISLHKKKQILKCVFLKERAMHSLILFIISLTHTHSHNSILSHTLSHTFYSLTHKNISHTHIHSHIFSQHILSLNTHSLTHSHTYTKTSHTRFLAHTFSLTHTFFSLTHTHTHTHCCSHYFTSSRIISFKNSYLLVLIFLSWV